MSIDLTASNVTFDGIYIEFQVNNIDTMVSPASTAGIYLSTDDTIDTSDSLLAMVGVPSVAGEGSVPVSATALTQPHLTPGTYYIGAVANYDRSFVETDFTNNASPSLAIILGNDSANTLTGTAGDDIIIGNGGGDTIAGLGGNDTYAYTSGFDSFDGGAGSNTLNLGNFGAAVWFGFTDQSGIEAWTKDQTTLTAGTWRALVDTTAVQNVIGTPFDDTINFDTLTFDNSTDYNNTYVYTGGFDTVNGGTGYDTIDMSRFTSAILFGIHNSNGIEISTTDHSDLTQGTLRGLVDIANHVGHVYDGHGGLSVEHIIGTAYDDTINADLADPQFTYSYTGGFDTYNGTSFNSTETLDLSLMTSAALYDPSNPNGHTVWTTDQSTLASGTLRAIMDVTLVENVTGTPYDDTIYGNSSINILSGGDGNDTFNSPGERDTISGGNGDDTMVYSVAPVHLGPAGQFKTTFDGGSGSDTLDLSHFTGAIWYGSDPSGIEVWGKYYGSGFSTDLTQGFFQGIVDVTSVENIIGTAYADQIYDDAAANRITGGGSADLLVGGGGGDTYVYTGVTDSTGVNYDTINYFDAARDKFDFSFAVNAVDTTVSGGALSTASFNSDLTAAIGAGQLAANHAVLFNPDTGSLSGHTFLIVDADGTAGYLAGQDFVIDLHLPTNLEGLNASGFV